LDLFQQDLVALLPRLRRFARALTGSVADADDLVQATVERALARRDQWRPGTRLDSWTLTMMRNAWIDEARARQRRSAVLQGSQAAETVADPAALDMDRRLALRGVEAAMAELPETQRIAVALVLVEGMSYAEAAKVLDVPIGTLTSRLVRGRQAILERLGMEGEA
jgi:RNA polymerase sigma-70 factor (ECF subfamily)